MTSGLKQRKHKGHIPLEESLKERSIPPGKVQTEMQKRAHPIKTLDGKFRCPDCGQIFESKTAVDAHHLRVHEQKPQMSNTGMPI